MAGDGVGVAAEQEAGGAPGGVRVLDEGVDLLVQAAAVAAVVGDPVRGHDGGRDAGLGAPVGERLEVSHPVLFGDDDVLVIAGGHAAGVRPWIGLQGDLVRVDDHLLKSGGALQGLSGGEAGGEVVAVDVGGCAGDGKRDAGVQGEGLGGGGVVERVDGDEGDGLAGEVGLTDEGGGLGWVRCGGVVDGGVWWDEGRILGVNGLW